jgi:hypothetical protein
MQDLYHKNGSTLTNEIKVNLCSWMGRFNIVNISVIHRVIDKFNMISIKIPVRFFFVDIDQVILKFIWKCREAR